MDRKTLLLFAVLSLFAFRAEASYDAHTAPDGSLIIVRSDSNLAAFVISDQRSTPTDEAKYEWLLFEKEESSNNWVKSGEGIGRTGDVPKSFLFFDYVTLNPIEIGPFKLYWSPKSPGHGWVYFRYFSKVSPNNYCISENERLKNTLEIARRCFASL